MAVSGGSMRAAVMRGYGGPEVLGVEEVPRPPANRPPVAGKGPGHEC